MADKANPFADWGAQPAQPGESPAAPASPPQRAGSGGGGTRAVPSRRRTLAWAGAVIAAAAIALVFALGVFKSGGGSPKAGATAASNGGPASAQLAPAAFRERFNGVCAQLNQSDASLGNPSSNNLVPWTKQLVTTTTQALARFRALTPPSSVAPGYQAYLAGFGIVVATTQRMEAAAKANNLAAFDRVVASLSHPSAAEQADSRSAALYGLNCQTSSTSTNDQDAAAKELAATAEITMETYATDENGSYAGATAKVLRQYESTIQIVPGGGNAFVSAVRVLAGGRGYVITTTAVGGDTFSIAREPSGEIARSCTTATGNQPSAAGCSSSHTW
jgi:hypothetical protein